MIGNDVVDLNLASREKSILRRAVLNKIFTRDEKILIVNADLPDTMAWLCWSQKEAAYKIVNRMTSHRFYAPQAFESGLTPVQSESLSAMPEFVVQDQHEPEKESVVLRGTVKYSKQTFFTMSYIDSDKIITLAAINVDFVNVKQKISTEFEPQNQQDLISHLLENTGFNFYKDYHGIPFLRHKSKPDLPATLSHHGHYMSLAWENQVLNK